jgi:hypothetical protein
MMNAGILRGSISPHREEQLFFQYRQTISNKSSRSSWIRSRRPTFFGAMGFALNEKARVDLDTGFFD